MGCTGLGQAISKLRGHSPDERLRQPYCLHYQTIDVVTHFNTICKHHLTIFYLDYSFIKTIVKKALIKKI